MPQLRLLATTALFSVIIWMAADQLSSETADLTVTITLKSEDGSRVVLTPAADAPNKFIATVKGRQANITALREAGTRNVTITLADDILTQRKPGPINVPLQEQLAAIPSLFPGCTVLSVTPPILPAMLDRRVEVSLPVRVAPGNLEYTVAPGTDQTAVTAVILESIWSEIEQSDPHIVLEAEPILREQPEDVSLRLDVRLGTTVTTDVGTLSAESVTPRTVTLRATLRRRLASGTIQAVPIRFMVSPNVQKRFDVEYRDENPVATLRLDVVGPPEEIDKLVTGETKAFAVIQLTSPDPLTVGTYQFYKPEFTFPKGVQLSPDQVVPSFEIRLIPRVITPEGTLP